MVALQQHVLVLGPLPVPWVYEAPTIYANPQLSSVPSRELNDYSQDLMEIVHQAAYAVPHPCASLRLCQPGLTAFLVVLGLAKLRPVKVSLRRQNQAGQV